MGDNTILSTFAGAVIGASAVILAGVISESYRRHRDMQGAASAISGEIFAIMDLAERRKHVESFTFILKSLEAGADEEIWNITGGDIPRVDPIIEKHMERIGLFPTTSRLPKKIAKFYTYIHGIRIDLIRLSSNELKGNPRGKAHLIKEDLALWAETVKLGKEIIEELDTVSEGSWWPIALLKKL